MTDYSIDPLVITPLSVAIHRRSESPIYGKGILQISLAEDGGDRHLLITQLEDDPGPGVIRLNPEELPALANAAHYLMPNEMEAAIEQLEHYQTELEALPND
jgi:hypothetical protein